MIHFIKRTFQKEPIFISVLIIAAIFAVVSWKSKATAPAVPEQKTTAVEKRGLPDIIFPQEITFATMQKTAWARDNKVSPYGLKLEEKYPTNTPFAERAKKHADDFITSFMNDYQDADLSGSSEVSGQINASASHGTKLASYLYADYRDQGGVHGITDFSSETFDANGKTYALADLFLPGTKYLTPLSELAIKHFENDPDVAFDPKDKIWQAGLSPEIKNFQIFTISGNTIIFQFQPYQIGSYSVGAPTFEVSINNPKIKSIIRAELF